MSHYFDFKHDILFFDKKTQKTLSEKRYFSEKNIIYFCDGKLRDSSFFNKVILSYPHKTMQLWTT